MPTDILTPTFSCFAFGLHICSELEFPELQSIASAAEPQVTIRYATEIQPTGEVFQGMDYTVWTAGQSFTLEIPGLCRYAARNGTEILVQPLFDIAGALPEDVRAVRLYILASMLAAVLYQRNLLPFHCASIVKDKGLLLICGDSGAGKSTTTAGLIKRGYTALADDVAVLREDGKGCASYPLVKLWEDTIDQLGHPAFSNKDFRVRRDMNKFGFRIAEQSQGGYFPVNAVIVLKKEAVTAITCRELRGTEAFRALLGNIYHAELIENLDSVRIAFHIFTKMLQKIRVIEVCRPENCPPDSLVDVIEQLVSDEKGTLKN